MILSCALSASEVCVFTVFRAILVMEYDEGSWKDVGGEASGFRFISRRKQVNSPRAKAKSPRHRLARALSVPEVVANGIVLLPHTSYICFCIYILLLSLSLSLSLWRSVWFLWFPTS